MTYLRGPNWYLHPLQFQFIYFFLFVLFFLAAIPTSIAVSLLWTFKENLLRVLFVCFFCTVTFICPSAINTRFMKPMIPIYKLFNFSRENLLLLHTRGCYLGVFSFLRFQGFFYCHTISHFYVFFVRNFESSSSIIIIIFKKTRERDEAESSAA